jgi:hypothetical protein
MQLQLYSSVRNAVTVLQPCGPLLYVAPTNLTLVNLEGSTEYATCSGLLTNSSSSWPGTALFEIAANGVALDKLVIGKPADATSASNGFIEPSTLAGCVAQAQKKGWSA